MEQQFCQSCGMPLNHEHYSKNADGSINPDYCDYCFNNGSFTAEVSMDEMIEQCLAYVDEFNKDAEKQLTKEEAREQMKQFFPMLKRWKA